MTEKVETVPKNYFSSHITILRFLGINIFHVKNPLFRLLYNVYSVWVIIFSFVIFNILEGLFVWFSRTDLDQMSYALSYLISHSMGCMKGIIFMLNKKSIRRYLESFEEDVFLPDVNRGGQEEVKIIKRAITVANIQANGFYVAAGFVILNRAIYAWRDEPQITEVFDLATNATTTIEQRTLPWLIYLWYDTTGSLTYKLTFFWQIWCVTLFGLEIGVLDTLVSAMLIHLNAQFHILRNAVASISERAERMQPKRDTTIHNNDNNGAINNDVEEITKKKCINDEGWEEIPKHDPIMARNFELCVKNCLDHHIKIIALSDNIEEKFNLMVLVQVLGSTIIFCMQLVQLSFMPLFSVRFNSMCMYLALMVFQLGIYCYNGNEISVQSEGIAEAAYSCNWYAAEDRVKKYLILMIARAQRPVRMSAGKFVYLSLAAYISLLRGSVSYFMVLHQQNAE